MNIYQHSNLVKLYLNLLVYILLRINYNSIEKKKSVTGKNVSISMAQRIALPMAHVEGILVIQI